MNLSLNNQALLEAYDKGYRVINEKVYSPFKKDFMLIKYNIKCPYPYFYFSIRFDNNKKRRKIMVHRLVAFQKFGFSIFKKGIEVRHLNGNSLDNSYKNIDIGTRQENQLDIPSSIRKRSAILASSKIRKFSDEETEIIRQRYNELRSYKKIMKEFNISSKGSLYYILHNNYSSVV